MTVRYTYITGSIDLETKRAINVNILIHCKLRIKPRHQFQWELLLNLDPDLD